CEYAPRPTGSLCDDGDACTAGDACRSDGCHGEAIACMSPPAATCAAGETLPTFSIGGLCSAGTCSYASFDTHCPFGCAAGACAGDPCASSSCTTPPPPSCLDATTLQSVSP